MFAVLDFSRLMTYCQMCGTDAASNARDGTLHRASHLSYTISTCLIGKVLCYFSSRARRLAFPIGKKPLFPYGEITVSDSVPTNYSPRWDLRIPSISTSTASLGGVRMMEAYA